MSAIVAATAIGAGAGALGLGAGGALLGAGVGAAVGSDVAGHNAEQSAQNTANQAIAGQQQALANLQYQPINIQQITADAHQAAVTNATQSLQLEQQLSPGVAATRTGLQNQVASQLALGGQLSPDMINEVTRATEAGGAGAGLAGSSLPLTAASLGLTSNALMQQRQAAAQSLLAANPLPQTGLNPGDIADLNVANTNAQNQFALSKLGANTSLANTEIGAAQSQAQAQANSTGQLLGALGTAGGLYNQNQQNNLLNQLVTGNNQSSAAQNSSANSILAQANLTNQSIQGLQIPAGLSGIGSSLGNLGF